MERILLWRRVVAEIPFHLIVIRRHQDICLDRPRQNKSIKCYFRSDGMLRRQVSKATESERIK
jgi:hypothetical protein